VNPLSAPTAADVQEWLVTHLARVLETDPDHIDPREPFASFGLGSLAAVELSADLDDWLGRPLPPTLAWDYPTIELLARHLGAEPAHVDGGR
jgi:acyl carrier protein